MQASPHWNGTAQRLGTSAQVRHGPVHGVLRCQGDRSKTGPGNRPSRADSSTAHATTDIHNHNLYNAGIGSRWLFVLCTHHFLHCIGPPFEDYLLSQPVDTQRPSWSYESKDAAALAWPLVRRFFGLKTSLICQKSFHLVFFL